MKSALLAFLALAAAEQSDNSYGYEAPHQEPQVFVQSVAPAQVCVQCFEHSPCWNGRGCVGLTEFQHSDIVFHSEAEYEKHAASRKCPCGTVDTRFYKVNNRAILWAAFALLFVPGIYFICRGYADGVKGVSSEWNTVR